MRRAPVTLLLVVVSIVEGVVIGVLVGATVSPVAGVVLGLGSVAAVWAAVVGIAWALGRTGTWAELWRRYPAAEGIDFGSGTRVISVGLGRAWFRLNGCVEARADEAHLHMRLGLPGSDGRPVSIPWEAVGRIEESGWGGVRLDVEGIALWVPRIVVREELELRASMSVEGVAAEEGRG